MRDNSNYKSEKTRLINKTSSQKIITSEDDIDLSLQKKCSKDITEMCKPLFDSFNINYFGHTRAFHDGRFLSLMTNPELPEYFLKNKYPISFSYGQGFFLSPGCYLADCVKRNFGIKEKLKTLCEEFNIHQFIHVIEKREKYDDMYSFGLTEENSELLNRFLNNIDLIKHFILYFKGKSSYFHKKIELVKYSQDYFLPTCKMTEIKPAITIDREKFFKEVIIKKVPVSGKLGEVWLSQREYECLNYASKNYSQKEIAKYMGVSPRTVETYLNNLKNKLGIDKRSQLMDFSS